MQEGQALYLYISTWTRGLQLVRSGSVHLPDYDVIRIMQTLSIHVVSIIPDSIWRQVWELHCHGRGLLAPRHPPSHGPGGARVAFADGTYGRAVPRVGPQQLKGIGGVRPRGERGSRDQVGWGMS